MQASYLNNSYCFLAFDNVNKTVVQGLSGHDGTVLSTQTYTAFGESRTATGTGNSTLKYTGRELDTDSGLYQYRARYYDPSIGRFISEDPKGFGAGVNFFAYVNNNPVNANDPSGLDSLPDAAWGAAIGGSIVALTSATTQYVQTGTVNLPNVGWSALMGATAGG